MKSIAWCITAYEYVDPYAAAGFLQSALALSRLGYDVEPFVQTGMSCEAACNEIMERVERRERERGSRFTHIFWMDDDVIVKPDEFERWIPMVDGRHRAMFGLAFYRVEPHQPGIWRHVADTTLSTGARMEHFVDYPENELVQVSCAGLCAAIFDRSVFNIISKPYFQWVEGGYARSGCTPDAFLCGKLSSAGVTLWCHTGIQLKHVGVPQLIDSEIARPHKERWAEV